MDPRLQVFGRVTVDKTSLTPTNRQLLATLVAVGSSGASAKRLVEDLFEGRRVKGSESKVRVDISRLRQRLNGAVIPLGGDPYRIDLPSYEVDYWELSDLYESRDLPTETTVLNRLLCGEPFPELETTSIIRAAIDKVEQARLWLLVSVAADAPELFDGRSLAVATDLARHNIFDRKLVGAVVHAHEVADVYADASRLIAFAEEHWREEDPNDSEMLDVLHDSAEHSATIADRREQTNGSIADELTKLAGLHESGVLTESEFTTQKRRLLNHPSE